MNNETKKDTKVSDVKDLEKKGKFNKGFFIGLGVTMGIEAIFSVCIFLIEFYTIYGGVYKSNIQLNNSLGDVFMLPGILCIMFYALVLVSREGAFDAITYSAKLVFYSIFAKNIRNTKLPATYGDYREMKRGKDRSSNLFLLFAAIPWLIVGLVFCCLGAFVK